MNNNFFEIKNVDFNVGGKTKVKNVIGNLLEIDGLACNKGNTISGNTDCMDNYGTTITNIYVSTRDAINTNYIEHNIRKMVQYCHIIL